MCAVNQRTAMAALKPHGFTLLPCEQQSDLTFNCDVEKIGSAVARPTQPSGERNTLDVWNQIRRTEEELMEMGTMDNTLLQGHGPGTEGRGRAGETLSRIDA